MTQTEIIQCQCGGVFAVSAYPEESDEWIAYRELYTKLGCTVRKILPERFKFVDCIPDCQAAEIRSIIHSLIARERDGEF